MISLVLGVVITAIGVASLWYMMPSNGVPHRWTRVPGIDAMLPIAIMTVLALGIALIVSGLA